MSQPAYRALDLARVHERVLTASSLLSAASSLLAELGVDQVLDLKAEIGVIAEANKNCRDAIARLHSQILRTSL